MLEVLEEKLAQIKAADKELSSNIYALKGAKEENETWLKKLLELHPDNQVDASFLKEPDDKPLEIKFTGGAYDQSSADNGGVSG